MKFVIAKYKNKTAILASWNVKTEPYGEFVIQEITEAYFTMHIKNARVNGANRKGYWLIPYNNWSTDFFKIAVEAMKEIRDDFERSTHHLNYAGILHMEPKKYDPKKIHGWVNKHKRVQKSPEFKRNIERVHAKRRAHGYPIRGDYPRETSGYPHDFW